MGEQRLSSPFDRTRQMAVRSPRAVPVRLEPSARRSTGSGGENFGSPRQRSTPSGLSLEQRRRRREASALSHVAACSSDEPGIMSRSVPVPGSGSCRPRPDRSWPQRSPSLSARTRAPLHQIGRRHRPPPRTWCTSIDARCHLQTGAVLRQGHHGSRHLYCRDDRNGSISTCARGVRTGRWALLT